MHMKDRWNIRSITGWGAGSVDEKLLREISPKDRRFLLK